MIGTGASAIQIVPKLQEVAAHLDVYQRTAPWVIPRNDRAYTRVERALFRRSALAQKAYRAGIYWGRELYVPAFAKQPKLAALAASALALAQHPQRASRTPRCVSGSRRTSSSAASGC